MIIQNLEAKEKLTQRLRKIEGQVRGVQGMLEDERDCREIMQQLVAVHSAIQGVSRVFLQEYATACLLELDEPEDAGQRQGSFAAPDLKLADRRAKRQKIVQDMIVLLDKAP